jgi:uncharacterized damage-inducible protein DinB
MESLRSLERLFRYDDWANRETLTSVQAASAPPAAAVKRMAHVLAAEWLWLARLKGETPPLPVWPDLMLSECEREAGRLPAAWRQYLAALPEGELSRRVSYVNSKGEPWESDVADILTHSLMHSVYHRGQIAADLRAAGFEPAYTDFIHAARRGLLE